MFFHGPRDRGISQYTVAWLLLLLFFGSIVVSQYRSLRTSVLDISCSHSKKNLQKGLEIFRDENSGKVPTPLKPIDIPAIMESEALKTIPRCGGGGTFKIDENGIVYCSLHDRDTEK
jgi:hypothetical protein